MLSVASQFCLEILTLSPEADTIVLPEFAENEVGAFVEDLYQLWDNTGARLAVDYSDILSELQIEFQKNGDLASPVDMSRFLDGNKI